MNNILEKNALNDPAAKKPIGGVGLPCFGGFTGITLRKVEQNEEKKEEPAKEQNLNYLSNILVQGAARKSKLKRKKKNIEYLIFNSNFLNT